MKRRNLFGTLLVSPLLAMFGGKSVAAEDNNVYPAEPTRITLSARNPKVDLRGRTGNFLISIHDGSKAMVFYGSKTIRMTVGLPQGRCGLILFLNKGIIELRKIVTTEVACTHEFPNSEGCSEVRWQFSRLPGSSFSSTGPNFKSVVQISRLERDGRGMKKVALTWAEFHKIYRDYAPNSSVARYDADSPV